MELSLENRGGIAIITVDGRLDAASAADLKAAFSEWVKSHRRFVACLSGMDFIDSTGLGALVSCLKRAAEADGEIKLCGLRAKPRMVFEITRAYKIFDIFDNLDAAVQSFQPEG